MVDMPWCSSCCRLGRIPTLREALMMTEPPCFIAAQNGHHTVTQLLLISGANTNHPDIFQGSPLYAASEHGHGIVVEQLITAGADLERRNCEQGNTALMQACRNGHRSIVRKLLRAGAEVDAMSGDGLTALHGPCALGNGRVVLLTDSGHGSFTPLCAAASRGYGAVIRVLLSAGADPDHDPDHDCDRFGGMLLFIAAFKGHSRAALELLSGGASLAKALTKARALNDGTCVQFLLAADRHHFASQSALDLMRGTDRLFGKEGRLKVSQRELSPEVLQEVAEEMA